MKRQSLVTRETEKNATKTNRKLKTMEKFLSKVAKSPRQASSEDELDDVFMKDETSNKVESEKEKPLKPVACSTPTEASRFRVPTYKAILRRPFAKKHSEMEALRQQNADKNAKKPDVEKFRKSWTEDSGFSSYSRPGPVVTITAECASHGAEKSWELEDTFQSEEEEVCSCGTQTTEESRLDGLSR